MGTLENSIRIKVTGKCNRNCSFCHQEGGMKDIDDISCSDELFELVNRLNSEFNLNTIAITGGEPLLLNKLVSLFKGLNSNTNIKNFSLTTNGTIEKDIDFWRLLIEQGLINVNISIPDILSNVYNDNNKTLFQIQSETIQMLNELNIIPTVNVVVYNDENHLFNTLDILFQLKSNIKIALLPELTSYKTFTNSQKIISETIKTLCWQKIGINYRKGTSNAVCDYITKNDKIIQVKTTKHNGKPQYLHIVCDNCKLKSNCQEGFYGLRIEKNNSDIMIRLCLYRSDSDVLLKYQDFFESLVFKEIKGNWS